MRRFANAMVRYRFWVILFIATVTVLFATQVRHLKIVIDPSAMLPKLHANVVGTTLAEKIFGSKYVVVLGVQATNGTSALQVPVLKVVQALTKDLASISGVMPQTMLSATADRAKAISGNQEEMRVEPMLPQPIDEQAIVQFERRMLENPVYQNTLLSADRSMASVSFSVDIGPKGFREVMDKIQPVIDRAQTPEVKIVASGTAVFFANVERFSARMAWLFPIALVLIGLVHLEAFRTKQGLILPLITALLAVVWSLGIMGAAGVSMDAFNATTPILILAVAAGHAVQVLKRYYEEYARLCTEHPRDPLHVLNDRAVVESLTKVAPVMLTAGLVAACGLFSLIGFEIATIRTFGLFTGLGILCAMVVELCFIPALRSYLPAPRPRGVMADASGHRLWDRLAAALAELVLHRPKSIVIGFVAMGLLALLAMSQINRENSTKSYFGESLQVRQEDRLLNTKLAGTNTLYVVFQGKHADHMKDPKVLRAIEDAQAYIATLPDVGKTISIVDLIKQMNRAMNSGKASAHALPTSQALVSQYLLMYAMSGEPTDFDAYIDYGYQNANLLVWMKNDSSQYAEAVVKRIRDYLLPRLPEGVSIQIGGSVPQTSALSETLVDGKMRNIAQMIGMVFLAGTVVFRSIMAGVYLTLPLMFTVLVNFGVMGLTGIPLNTPNSVSSAMAIGIGADYAIYLLYRIREELCKTQDVDVALLAALQTAGKAVVYVASAISVGYAVLMLSLNFYVHIWFGLLIVLSMVVSALSALVLIPALIKLHLPSFLKRGVTSADAYGGDLLPMATLPRLRMTPLASVWLSIALSAAVGAASLFVGHAVQAQGHDADVLMEKNYQASRVDSSTSTASFRLVNAAGQERTRTTFGVSKVVPTDKSANRRVIRFLSPSDVRNTTTLLIESAGKEDEIWVYLPALKKARRLASNNKKNSFVGTDLSFGDLVGHKASDWQHKFQGEESWQGVPVQIVSSTPKTAEIAAESGYSRRVSWIDPKTSISLKVVFYDAGGMLLKTVENSQVTLVDANLNKYQPMQITVKNHQTGHGTHLKFEHFEANKAVPESYFSQSYLEKEE